MTHTSAMTMSEAEAKAPPNLLTRLVRLVGHLTDPKTAPGRLFTAFERRSTALFGKLATNERYLRFAGRGLEASFNLRRGGIEATEELLHLMRLPAVSEVNELRYQVRSLHDRLEVTNSQLELALALLERMEKRAHAAGEEPRQ
ncbi:MAG: hypothetical protein IPK80_06900 [Nannocystis sp.]|nr:hypothetical protein [Nannocystis sp.]